MIIGCVMRSLITLPGPPPNVACVATINRTRPPWNPHPPALLPTPTSRTKRSTIPLPVLTVPPVLRLNSHRRITPWTC